jgi:hypothetical protein
VVESSLDLEQGMEEEPAPDANAVPAEGASAPGTPNAEPAPAPQPDQAPAQPQAEPAQTPAPPPPR